MKMDKNSLQTLFAEHRGKLSDKWSIYIAEYERLFRSYRNRHIRFLEIGIQNGGSLEIWGKYFPKAKIFVGCDINPNCTQLQFDDARITLVVADANNYDTRQQILNLSPEFDLIIDDGSHLACDIVRSFALYFPHLNDGGLYIAEDLHCSYWKSFDGGLFQPFAPISFFKHLADIINHEHWGVDKARTELLRSFNQQYKVYLDEIDLAHIHSIEFINSICVIKRDKPVDNVLGTRVISGTEALVDTAPLHLHGSKSLHQDQSENEWSARDVPIEQELKDRILDLSKLHNIVQEREIEIQQRDQDYRQTLETMQVELRHLDKDRAKREQEIALQLLIIHQQFTTEKNELIQLLIHAEKKIEIHLCELVEREKLFSLQLQEIHKTHDLQKDEQRQRYDEYEKAYFSQRTELRQQLEASYLAMSNRESEFSQQLLVAQQLYTDHKNEQNQLFRENERTYQAQMAQIQEKLDACLLLITEREVEFSKQLEAVEFLHENQKDRQNQEHSEYTRVINSELGDKQDEVNHLLAKNTEIQKQLLATSANFRQEINFIHGTYSWRLTAPLRGLAKFFGANPIQPVVFGSTVDYQVLGGVTQSSEKPELGITSTYNTNIRIFDMSSNQKSHIPKSLEELMSMYDERFVDSAYRALLGRVPDAEGMSYYLLRLRSGISKIEILAQLNGSEESKSRKAEIIGLDEALTRYKLLKTPLLGSFLKLIGLNQLQENPQRRLYVIENNLYLSHLDLQQKISELNIRMNKITNFLDANENFFLNSETKKNIITTSKSNESDQSKNSAGGFFDAEWYIARYPDVAESGISPYEHYLQYGKKEGRYPAFDEIWYQNEYPDVLQSGQVPRAHYFQIGIVEGRHPIFDSEWYLNQYPDVVETGMDPYEHYVAYGKAEHRYPLFDREWYVSHYLDVQAAGLHAFTHYIQHGRSEGRFAIRSTEALKNDYPEWVRQYDTLDEKSRSAMHEIAQNFVNKPLISVVMPVYNPNPDWLIEAIESVRSQIYSNWELCIADDLSPNLAIRPILERYAKEDSRIKVVFRSHNGHISSASNSALEVATGGWVALLDHDDLIPEHALFWVANAINKNPDIRLIYSDEDKIHENGIRSGPYFKSDWNPDLFYSHNMFSHLGVYDTQLIRQVGGFRKGLEGSQDYDLALRCIELIKPNQIHHIPRVLYNWRVHAESTSQSSDAKPYAMIAGERAINEHLQRTGVKAKAELIIHGYRVKYELPKNLPLVTLIIPTRNGFRLLKQCVLSIIEKTTYENYEILIIDNGSDDVETLNYLKSFEPLSPIRVIQDPRPFNFSALCNVGVKLAKGDIIGLVNDDIEVISPDWLSEMVSHALRPEVGAVGAKLLYPDDTIQHAGVILGVGGIAAHAHKYFAKNNSGYIGRANLIQSFSAVTGACLIIKKSIYEALDGLNEEELQVSYNDIDFCLRVRAAGYRNIWTPYALLYHYESATRGPDTMPEKQARHEGEMSYMEENWGHLLKNDPAYNLNLTVHDESFSLSWPPRLESISPL
jgi:O-antigen biosynthesis protein